jgi:hypothetical protein
MMRRLVMVPQPTREDEFQDKKDKEAKMQVAKPIVLVVLIGALTGCGGSDPSPTTPSPAPVQLAVFSDPASSSFTTSDVRDAQRQIVRFDVANNALIWGADGRSFPGFPVNGLFVRADRFFQVRFGTEEGERRAYFTEAVATTICDVEIVNGQVVITATSLTVPGS